MRHLLALASIVALTVAGCGGSSHPRVEPEVMLDSAAAHPVTSAQTEIDLRVQVTGLAQLSAPLHLRLEGGYVSGGDRRIPSFDWRFTASALGFPVGGRVVSTGLNAYLSVYGDDYEVGTGPLAAANEWINRADESDEPLDLRPRSWFGRARIEGEASEGGTDCERIAAPLRAAALAGDLDAVARALQLSSPPVVRGTVRGCVGFDDRVFHQFGVDADVGIPAADRERLGGASSAHVELDVVNSDIGEQQHISAPAGGGYRPIRDLLLTLNDLGVPIPL
jgi:hypothetical protein